MPVANFLLIDFCGKEKYVSEKTKAKNYMNLKKTTLAFIIENRTLSISAAVLFLGGAPLYIYALSIGQLPDFSLADLTGTLIVSFLTEILFGTAMVSYMLFAGFATRKTVSAFYPNEHVSQRRSWDKPSSASDDTHHYLIHGRFIVGVTVISLLVWFGVATKPFNSWLVPQHPEVAKYAYVVSLIAVGLLVFFDWRRGWRLGKYALFGISIASITFIGVLVVSYLGDFISEVPDTEIPSASPSVSFAEINTWLRDTARLLLGDNLVSTAFVVGISVMILSLLAVYITRKHRYAVKLGNTPPAFFKNETIKLLVAKIAATLTFIFCSLLVVMFFGVVVDAGPIHAQTTAAFVGGSYLIILNWIAFSVSNWRNRVILGLITFSMIFILIPMQSGNPVLFPKAIVKALGVGNFHAASIALSGMQCSTLASYGVNCDAKKDTSIGITNVNILNRLGSTVLLEFQVQRSAKTTTLPIADPSSNLKFEVNRGRRKHIELDVLKLPAAISNSQIVSQLEAMYPCDKLLLERLRADDLGKPKADELFCVTLSVPRDQLLGYTMNGPRTYFGDFSRYVTGV